MTNDIIIKVHDGWPPYRVTEGTPPRIYRWRWYCRKCQRGGYACSIDWKYIVSLALSHIRTYHVHDD